MNDRLSVLPQYLLPKQALTELAGRQANRAAGARTTAVIRWFIRRYGVNMAEALNPDPAAYPTFNEFFTRPLKPGARPLAQAEPAPPAPIRTTRDKSASGSARRKPQLQPDPSVLCPTHRSPSRTIVLTAPIARASSDKASSSGITACLHG